MRQRKVVNTPCYFYVRTPVASVNGVPKYHYRELNESTIVGFPMREAPAVGDRVVIDGEVFEVLERQWTMIAKGSACWPYGATEPIEGQPCWIIVKPSIGIFSHEAELAID